MWMAQQLFRETKPLRSGVVGLLGESLKGGDILQNLFYQPVQRQIESQTGEARRQLMNVLPQGGSLERALSDLEMGRLGERSQAATQIRQGLFSDALATAFGGALQPVSGLMGIAAQPRRQQVIDPFWGQLGMSLGQVGAALIGRRK